MAAVTTSPLERTVARVRLRLFLQTLLTALAWSWAAALLLSAAWFLVEPRLVRDAAWWLRWAVAGGSLGLGALMALLFAWQRSPSRLTAALALDERYNLKERVTTSLGLHGLEADSAAGRALVADVNLRLAPLRLAERFPVRLSWSVVAVSVLALVLVLLSFFPRSGGSDGVQASDGIKLLTDDPALKQAIAEKKKDLLKPLDNPPADKRPRDPALMKLLDDAELAHQPTDTPDEAHKFVKDAAKKEEALHEAERKEAARQDAMKDRISQEERLNPDRFSKKKKEGAAKNLQDAMKDGDMQRASDELQRLSKMLDPEQQKRIADKLDKLKDKLGDKDLTPEDRARIQQEFDKLKDDLLNDEQKKDIQQALNDLEKALDDLAEPEKQEKKLEDKLAEQKKKAEEQAQERADEQKKAEDQVKEAQKKFDDLSKNPDEQKKIRQLLKDLDKKAQDLEAKDVDPKEKAEAQQKIEEEKQELQKQADAQSKNPEEQKKAEEELKKAQQEADEQRKQEKAERQQAERELDQTRRELEEMKKNNERIDEKTKQEMKDLAQKLAESEKAMKEGKDAEAAKKLQEARDKMRQMSGDADRQQILQQLQRLQAAREAVCRAMDAKNGENKGDGDNAGGRGVASGKRPLGKDEETKHYDTTSPSELGKGPLRITEFLNGPGGERGARGPAQMTEEMRIRAAQEGASALTRQRVERASDTDRVIGYFDKMRGPEKAPPMK